MSKVTSPDNEQALGSKHNEGEASISDEDNTTEGQQSTTNPSVHEDVSTEGEVSKHTTKLHNASSNASKAAQQGNGVSKVTGPDNEQVEGGKHAEGGPSNVCKAVHDGNVHTKQIHG